MGRARRKAAAAASKPAAAAAARPRRRGRRALLWLALLGGLAYALVRWQQQQVDLDEGVWHKAPPEA